MGRTRTGLGVVTGRLLGSPPPTALGFLELEALGINRAAAAAGMCGRTQEGREEGKRRKGGRREREEREGEKDGWSDSRADGS